MSVVVGLKYKDNVWLACDKQITAGDRKTMLDTHHKIFPVPERKGILIGSVGALRGLNLLETNNNYIDELAYFKKEIDYTYMVNDFPLLINELFKDTYVFDFLDREKIKSEKDLKKQMIDNILKFLQELGPGFSLVGKEYKLTTPTEETFYIDLLLYHTKIHAYVVIEVKIGKFQPADFGQLVFYVNAIDTLEKTDIDEPTIGLLLCKDADTFVAQTTLKNSSSKVGISKYKFIEELHEYLSKKIKNLT